MNNIVTHHRLVPSVYAFQCLTGKVIITLNSILLLSTYMYSNIFTGFAYIVHIVTLLHGHQRITMAAQEICQSVAKQHIKSHDVDRSLLEKILSGNYSNNIT